MCVAGGDGGGAICVDLLQQGACEGDGQQRAESHPKREQQHLAQAFALQDFFGCPHEETERRELDSADAVASQDMNDDRNSHAGETGQQKWMQESHQPSLLLRNRYSESTCSSGLPVSMSR